MTLKPDTTAPLIVKGYTISPELFTKGFRSDLGPQCCGSQCCSGGVYVDIREHEAILFEADLVKKHMDETQTTNMTEWFEPEALEHSDFSSGACIGTREINGKCAFLDKLGRCSLQLAAGATGRHKWALKPLYCVLFPVEISDRIIGFDDLLQGEAGCCSIGDDFETPLFRGCFEELTHLLGADGYAALEEHYVSMLSQTEKTTTKE